jgi:hypothetical protein
MRDIPFFLTSAQALKTKIDRCAQILSEMMSSLFSCPHARQASVSEVPILLPLDNLANFYHRFLDKVDIVKF